MYKEEEKSRMVCPFRVHGVTTPSATIPDDEDYDECKEREP